MGKEISSVDNIQIAESMLEHINKWDNKPCEIKLEELDLESPSMMLQQLPGAVKETIYIDGSYIGAWPFAVYIHLQADDTKSRLSAIKRLNELNEWFNETALPDLGETRKANKIEMTSLPSMISDNDDGTEDYQVLFKLEYKQKGRLS